MVQHLHCCVGLEEILGIFHVVCLRVESTHSVVHQENHYGAIQQRQLGWSFDSLKCYEKKWGWCLCTRRLVDVFNNLQKEVHLVMLLQAFEKLVDRCRLFLIVGSLASGKVSDGEGTVPVDGGRETTILAPGSQRSCTGRVHGGRVE